MMTVQQGVGIVIVAMAAALMGCASTGKVSSSSTSTVSAMADLEKVGERVAERVAAVVADLDGLVQAKDGDPKKAFKSFASDLKRLESEVDSARRRAVAMRARADDHYESWAKELTGIENPDIRARAQQRREQYMADFRKLNEEMQQVRESFDPFMGDLQDILVYLTNDLNASSIAAVEDLMSRAKQSGMNVTKQIQDVIVSVSQVRQRYTASG